MVRELTLAGRHQSPVEGTAGYEGDPPGERAGIRRYGPGRATESRVGAQYPQMPDTVVGRVSLALPRRHSIQNRGM